ncbi:MAG: twin-arginine translocation signal domain-containing protein, partial [Verrucomicrobia bacterium]|nr:twin-arginine translocation signal domain-containing protein [Verrucomicrobiota bacterium]
MKRRSSTEALTRRSFLARSLKTAAGAALMSPAVQSFAQVSASGERPPRADGPVVEGAEELVGNL